MLVKTIPPKVQFLAKEAEALKLKNLTYFFYYQHMINSSKNLDN